MMRRALLLSAVCMLSAATASAQVRAGASVRFESYSFSDPAQIDLEGITLFTVPLSAVAPLTRQLELGISGAFARAALTRGDGDEATLSGMTDTELRLTASLANDRVRLGIVALLPTGQSELSAAELDVAGAIAADLFPFAISNWGTGGGVGMNAALATPLDDNTSIGFSAGYVMARAYEPIAGANFAYRPGNQLHVRAGLDRTFGTSGKAALQVVYQQFSADESEGDQLYHAGNRLQAVASYAFAVGAQASGVFYGGYLRRQRGRYPNAVQLTPAQDLIYAGAGMRFPVARLVLLPALDVRVLGNEDGREQGYTLSAGTGVELPLGAAVLVPAARARFGKLTVSDGINSGFTGIELALTLRTRRNTP